MQLVEAVRDVRIVLEVGGILRAAVAERPPERVDGERLPELGRGGEKVGAVEAPRPLREGREREPVPGRDDLVVEGRLRPVAANLEQPGARVVVQLAADDRPAVLERLQEPRRRALLDRPRVREPLDAVGVRVLRRGEAAARQPQLAHHVVERLLRDLPIPLLARDLPRVEVRRDEQCVVVEHLLEVRHEPLRVDGVAVEAAADEVVHPARRHPIEREAHRVE